MLDMESTHTHGAIFNAALASSPPERGFPFCKGVKRANCNLKIGRRCHLQRYPWFNVIDRFSSYRLLTDITKAELLTANIGDINNVLMFSSLDITFNREYVSADFKPRLQTSEIRMY